MKSRLIHVRFKFLKASPCLHHDTFRVISATENSILDMTGKGVLQSVVPDRQPHPQCHHVSGVNNVIQLVMMIAIRGWAMMESNGVGDAFGKLPVFSQRSAKFSMIDAEQTPFRLQKTQSRLHVRGAFEYAIRAEIRIEGEFSDITEQRANETEFDFVKLDFCRQFLGGKGSAQRSPP